MWEVARGVLVSGVSCYPLHTLGDDQLHRVVDAAALHRYRQLGGPNAKRGMSPPLNGQGWSGS